jgi:PAS domain S-box-containing protein
METTPKKTNLRALLVDDSEFDTELLVRELQDSGYTVAHQRVDTAQALQAALAQSPWDLVISDYKMPRFGGLQALELVKASGLDLPFILVSGAVGEELAVAAMRAGADDYLVKGRLARLGPAVDRELRDAADRRARRESDEQVRQLSHAVHQAPVSLIITDTAGTIEYVNPKFAEVTGYSFEEVRGKNPRILKSGEVAAAVYKELWDTIAAGREWRGVLHNRRKNGELFWESLSITSIRNAAGTITHYLAAVEDITARRQAEEERREQAALLDIATDAIYVRTLDHIILYWNQGAERLYGWTRDEVLNRKSTVLFSQDFRAIEASQKAMLQEGNWSGERRHVSKAGKILTVFTRMTLVRDARGQPHSIFSINTDITEKKQLETQFLRAQRLESLGALASGIAHDLNNVLAPIVMGAQLLRDTIQTDAGKRLVTTIESSARRGADIVKQVLTFARGIDGERVPLQPKHFLKDMATIAEETFPKNIVVDTDIAANLWPVIGDGTQLHQALMNLCVNARDAMPAGGTLTLRAANVMIDETFKITGDELTAWMAPDPKPGPKVCLSVIDTGMGIPAENLDKIFEPFFTTKAPGKGTGLGLSTVLGIARSHDGFVRIKTEEGKGTCFELYLPALPAAEVAVSHQGGVELPHGRGQLILVVDDESAVRDVTRRMLEKHDYKVLTAVEGGEAVGIFMQHHATIAAVVSDMVMPGMDGPTLVQLLKQIDPGVRIIGMSGLGDHFGANSHTPWGLPMFLTKPFTGEKLLIALRELLRAPPQSLPISGAAQPPSDPS